MGPRPLLLSRRRGAAEHETPDFRRKTECRNLKHSIGWPGTFISATGVLGCASIAQPLESKNERLTLAGTTGQNQLQVSGIHRRGSGFLDWLRARTAPTA